MRRNSALLILAGGALLATPVGVGGALLGTPLGVGGALLGTSVDVGGALPATSVGVGGALPATSVGVGGALPATSVGVGGALLATPLGVAPNPITQPALNRQIDRVLENPEFNWRESYSPAQGSSQKSLIDQLISWTRQTLLSLGDALNRLWKSLLKVFDFKNFFAEPSTSDSQLPAGIFNALTYLLWAAFAGILILFVIRLRKLRATGRPMPVVTPPMPDLTDEQIAANQLPDDEWSALARQKIVAGEFRQALRALFLAILALLASHRFIAVERWKSNSDYEMELRRKAKPRSDLLALFAQSRLGFERCWYGADSITSEDLASYNGIYESIKHAATHNL